MYWQLPEEVPALKEIIDIAMPLDSIRIVYDAMAGLSRYYPAINVCPSRGALLKQYDHLLDSLERKYNGEGKIFPVKRHRCLMSCYYCELYTMKGNSGKAQAYLDQATAYLDSSFWG